MFLSRLLPMICGISRVVLSYGVLICSSIFFLFIDVKLFDLRYAIPVAGSPGHAHSLIRACSAVPLEESLN